VGTPKGVSSNSWKIWVRRFDTYVACRDNFREFKVSLHASGIWRVALTKETVAARPELFSGGDRILHKWSPDLSSRKPVIGFQLIVMNAGLYLQKRQRRGWPTSVVFVEPPSNPEEMTILSVTIVQSRDPLVLLANQRSAVISLIPLGSDRTVQTVATHSINSGIESLVRDSFERFLRSYDGAIPTRGLFFVHGHREDGTPWITAVPFIDQRG
jgi:hypothetical protein